MLIESKTYFIHEKHERHETNQQTVEALRFTFSGGAPNLGVV
jgi:hypothetical protein